jgi:hypothetical protein
VNIVFRNQEKVTAVIEAINVPKKKKILPNNDDYVMLLRDYRSYDFSSKTGVIQYYDLNYDNHHGGTIHVLNSKIKNWQTFEIPDYIRNKYKSISNVAQQPHYCDSNKSGNVSYSECYSCMSNTCQGDEVCQTMCDILDIGGLCTGTIAASCVYISLVY